jgi:hypothetical protein
MMHQSPCFSFRHYINFPKGFLSKLSFKDSLGVINLYHVVDIVIKFVHKHANPIKLQCGQEVNGMFIKPHFLFISYLNQFFLNFNRGTLRQVLGCKDFAKNIPMFQKRLTLNFSIHLFAQPNSSFDPQQQSGTHNLIHLIVFPIMQLLQGFLEKDVTSLHMVLLFSIEIQGF